MSIRRSLPILIASLATAQGSPFRSGLTATVVVKPGSPGQSCGEVTLHWPAHPAAKSYRAYVSVAKPGAWTPLPITSACGTGHQAGPTGFADRQPAQATTRRLFYRVMAIGSTGPIDSTDVVPVELAPSVGGRR